jgi:hypothetical protein
MYWRRLALSTVLLVPVLALAQSNPLKTPNVSGNALFLYRNSNFNKADDSTVRNGIDLQEAELAFYADVDPYSRLSMLFSAAPEYRANPYYTPAAGQKFKQEWKFEPEELFAETDHIPGVTVKIGKFKAAFGKHNTLHSHAYPFVDAPMINAGLLGDEGLNDVGLSAAALIPFKWFSEFTAQYLRGEGENDEFSSPTPGDGVGVARLKNLWDLTDDLTMEVGASYARGNNDFKSATQLAGGDLTFKWRPSSGGKYHSGILAFEFIDRKMQKSGAADDHGYGLASWIQYQFAERWIAKARYETLQRTGSGFASSLDNEFADGVTTKGSALIEFAATEFSFFRLEYDQAHGPQQTGTGLTNEHKIYLQGNFTIGSHPAHSY